MPAMPEDPMAAAAAAAVAAPPPMAAASAAMGAPPAPTAATTPARTNAENELAGFIGKVEPTTSKLRRSKRKGRKGGAPRAERVPPSSPEQVEAARRGEYDYTGGSE